MNTLPPFIPKDVLDYLDKVFPNKVPTSKTVSLDDFRYLQGQLSVIECLKARASEQELNVFSVKP